MSRFFVGARVGESFGALIIDGLRNDGCRVPSVGRAFHRGNCHVQELNLCFFDVRFGLWRLMAAFIG